MASKAEKQMQQQLLALQKQSLQLQIDAANRAAQPDPNLQKLIGLNNSVVDWSTGANGLKDIYKHPTLATKLPVFELAMSNRDAGRVGKGVSSINAGQSGGDMGYGKDLQLEDNYRRQMMASGALESSLDSELGNAQGNLAALTGQQTNAYTTGAGIASGAGSQMAGMIKRLDDRIAQGGFWSKLGRGLLKYGVPAATSIFTGGLSSLAGLGGGAASTAGHEMSQIGHY